MKTESNIKPLAPFEIENLGEFADIIFYENIEPVMRDDEEHWQFDAYRLTGVRNRDGLEASIAANLAAWRALVKEEAPEPPTEADRIAALEAEIVALKKITTATNTKLTSIEKTVAPVKGVSR